MVAFVGDTHLGMERLAQTVSRLPKRTKTVIHVGDLMSFPDHTVRACERWRPLDRTLYYLCGNHHYYPETRGLREPTEVRPGLVYLPRGCIFRVDGLRIAVLGGAETVRGKKDRTAGKNWWPNEERITNEDMARFRSLRPGDVDILVTHTPPARIVERMLDGKAHPSAWRVQEIWERLGRPELVSGHVHEHFKAPGVEVLPMFGITYR